MNNKTSATGRASELEKDLIGEEVEQKTLIESGRKNVNEGTPFQQQARQRSRTFNVQSGFRRRHPLTVLSNFTGVTQSSEGVSSVWEKEMQSETDRFEMPKEFTPNRDVGMTNQLGVSDVARKNFNGMTPKLSKMHLVGV